MSTKSSNSVVLIGDGPSKSKYIYDPFENRDIAVVNGAMYSFMGKVDYWYTLHPTVFFDKHSENIKCRRIGIGPRTKGTLEFEQVTGTRLFPMCGSSSRFAAEQLLEVEGYEKLYLYGVDLDVEPYKHYREHWRELIDKHKDKLIDHSIDGWIQRRIDDTR